MTRKLNNHKYAQAHVETYPNGRNVLYSYKTAVVDVDKDGWVKIRGLYSRTTIKHIGWFMREMGSSYQTAKRLYEGNLQMNIHTGEVKAV